MDDLRKSHDPLAAPAIRLADGHVLWGGSNHAKLALNAVKHLPHLKDAITQALVHDEGGTGFVTTTGRFIGRREAVAHAREHGQLHDTVPAQLKFLDAGDVKHYAAPALAKSIVPQIEVHHSHGDDFHGMQVHVTVPGSPHGARLELYRRDHHPAGEWQVGAALPTVNGKVPQLEYARSNANHLGPAAMRHVARHLRNELGITKLAGSRITGTRAHGRVVHEGVPVKRELTKSLGEPSFESEKKNGFLYATMKYPNGNGMTIALEPHASGRKGHYNVEGVVGIKNHMEQDVLDENMRGHIGVGAVRGMVRYLKDTHNVKMLHGERWTGAKPFATPVARKLTKAIDYDELDDAFDPPAKKGGKGSKGSPVGSRTDQARHERPRRDGSKNRWERLKGNLEKSMGDRIVAPAIRLASGHVIAAPKRSDDNFPIHGDAVMHALSQGHSKRDVEQAIMHPEGTGFVTRSGKYLSRREAIPVVLGSKQLSRDIPKGKAGLLQHQYDTGKENVALDSFDIDFFAKALQRLRGTP